MHAIRLPTPEEICHELPLDAKTHAFIQEVRQQVLSILNKEDHRLLWIVGPCSIEDISSAKEYAHLLKELSYEVSDAFILVMRVYFEKPRTVRGWKGLLYDPWINGSNDLETGIRWTRQLLLDLAKLQLPTAAEFLDPTSPLYFGDLLTWGSIGARTASSQIHRQMASGSQIPIGFKNSVDGSIENAVNGIITASHPHAFMGINYRGQVSAIHTQGNPQGHLVLRGGESKPNYDLDSVEKALKILRQNQLSERLLIDCSHDNAHRQHENQQIVLSSVLDQILKGNDAIRGVLLESHLHAGNQSLYALAPRRYGVSITDPCLDWQTTKKLIRSSYQMLKYHLVEQANSIKKSPYKCVAEG